MILSFWRFLHLSLAIASSLFLTIASVTGIILACNTISEEVSLPSSENLQQISIADFLKITNEKFDIINKIDTDNQRIKIEFIENDNSIEAYINPKNGEIISHIQKENSFIKNVKTLHRSLFLDDLGRFFMGIFSFLLTFISISGIILTLKQNKLKSFIFPKINTNKSQFLHSILGRFFLIPILIISLTGAYLSANRFFIKSSVKYADDITFENKFKKIQNTDFQIFKDISLANIKSLTFPFSDDEEDFYTLKLKDKELIISQLSGEIIKKIEYPTSFILTNLSFEWHTGKNYTWWSIILIISCIHILFFIYSGFKITFQRKFIKIKNHFTSENAEIILLFGSEMGSTFQFINAVYQQLIKQKKKVFLSELNKFNSYKNAKYIIVFTSTYGNGEAPENAKKSLNLIKKFVQKNKIYYSVVGFGSKDYPNFCQFAKEIQEVFQQQNWAKEWLPLHTIDKKSASEFTTWCNLFSQKSEIKLNCSTQYYIFQPKKQNNFKIISKSNLNNHIFSLTLKTNQTFCSGDLFAIYPKKNQERLYSIGKINGNIHLSVRLHPNGLGSNFLHNTNKNSTIKGNIIENKNFHFPKIKNKILMICNGTGIAPFLGMIQENENPNKFLFAGFRNETDFELNYSDYLKNEIKEKRLSSYQTIFSNSENGGRVTQLVQKNSDFIAQLLQNGGVIMLCGSKNMYNDVAIIVNEICKKNGTTIDFYKNNNQWISDCY